jgi:hypothetical protein
MKQLVVLALLAASTYFYFHSSAPPAADFWRPISSRPTAAAPTFTIVPAPSYDRWKTGPNAQTDLKTGPNAQTDFEPFAPNEQATWNQNPGWTVVSGIRLRSR